MPDISMCVNDKCEKKDNCHRFTATPHPFRQCYAQFEPIDGNCEGYWPNKKERDGQKNNLSMDSQNRFVQTNARMPLEGSADK